MAVHGLLQLQHGGMSQKTYRAAPVNRSTMIRWSTRWHMLKLGILMYFDVFWCIYFVYLTNKKRKVGIASPFWGSLWLEVPETGPVGYPAQNRNTQDLHGAVRTEKWVFTKAMGQLPSLRCQRSAEWNHFRIPRRRLVKWLKTLFYIHITLPSLLLLSPERSERSFWIVSHFTRKTNGLVSFEWLRPKRLSFGFIRRRTMALGFTSDLKSKFSKANDCSWLFFT